MASILVGQSDLLYVKELHEDTLLITVSNERDYAGIIYEFGAPVLNYRLRARFYEERFPEENESETDGEGSIDKLSSAVKTQRHLELDPMPPYMHKKIKLALQHNSIFIENQSWLKEEEYELQKLSDKYPFFSGSCFLTLKDDNYVINT
jgi:hypothetical protein